MKNQPPEQRRIPLEPRPRTFADRLPSRRRRLLSASRWRARGIDLRAYVRGIEQVIGRASR